MAHFMLASSLSLGGSEMANYLNSLQSTHSQADLDDTLFSGSFKARIGGLQDYQQSAGFLDDYADNLLDEIMFAFWSANSIAVQWRYGQNTTETASNPEYGYTAMLLSDQTGGGVGEEAKRSCSLAIASGALTRDIT
jgi:hypothetical protein